jgi:pseudaminic acid cytidylyltransferase
MRAIAVIPARGGSKRIPKKNIKDFDGIPIIAWSIKVAIDSGLYDSVIVSTDDHEIAQVAIRYGASVPFIRPSNLSDDFANTFDVVRHAVQWLIDNKHAIDAVCCIYATAPFLQKDDLSIGQNFLRDPSVDFSFSVTPYDFPIQRAIKLNQFNQPAIYNPEYFKARSQDLEKLFHDAAQFYWGKVQAWLSEKSCITSKARAVVLPRYRVLDIDDEDDWFQAEMLFKCYKSQFGL